MALYVRLDRTTVEGLVRRFGIEDVTAFSVMDGGSENTNYCVNTISGKYVLTLCDQKSLRQVTDLVSLLVHLTGHGIRTSSVVVPIEASIVILHDENPIMLKRYVDGDITADLTRNVLVQLGEELACLHEISVPSFLPKSFPYGLDYFSEVMDSNLDHAYIDWLSEKKTYLQERIPQHLPKSLIHGDVFFDNVIVRDDQLMAIIDFEEACYYYRNFDLGMAIVGSCRDGQGISFEKAGYFLRAYGKKVGLQPIERESLKVFAVYAAVATSFWRFRQYHLRRPEPPHCHKHVEMQALADTISKYPESSFTELFT